jgi:tetratricopeptide (TPR) repeat protein
MTKVSVSWKPFPYDGKPFHYAGAKLKAHWEDLHRGDRETYPDEAALERLVETHRALKPSGTLKSTAKALQDAWRAFHEGHFGSAVETGLSVGRLGYNVANKAINIYTTYLETDKDRRSHDLLQVVRRAEDLQQHAPTLPNAWFLHAQALGRYSQMLSIAKALAEGTGAKVKHSLDETLRLEPGHADANIALGLYHALIIHKLGSTMGALTYGASKDAAIAHFEKALKLNPNSAISRVEYANALVMMYGKSKLAEATGLYEKAAASEPADAMQRFDVELARKELAD